MAAEVRKIKSLLMFVASVFVATKSPASRYPQFTCLITHDFALLSRYHPVAGNSAYPRDKSNHALKTKRCLRRR